MSNDADLLRRFAETSDQACFSELVQRHIGLVYAVARRRLRDSHAAQDATQAVFVALARKAGSVSRCPSIAGWLHRSATLETRNMIRQQVNRVARETEAVRLGVTGVDFGAAPNWPEIETVLDEVLCELSDVDREAILARFFLNRSYSEIGAGLRLTESAARMRVERALVKLRDRLQRRGIESTAAALGLALPACASAAPPMGIISSVTKAAVAAGAVPAYLAFMSTMKIATAIAVIAAAGGLAYEYHRAGELETTVAMLTKQREVDAREFQTLRNQLGELRERVAANIAAAPAASTAKLETAPAAEPPPPPGVTTVAPAGWHKNGSNPKAYAVGVDQLQMWGGMPSAYVKSIAPTGDGFGGMMQTVSAQDFLNKRVRLTGWIKTENAADGGHLWLRVDGQSGAAPLQFDNMEGREPKGTTDWQQYSVVLDVPPGATTLNYGFFIHGSGQMWVNGVTIDPVGGEVPSTNMVRAPKLPTAPVNLGFTPNPPS